MRLIFAFIILSLAGCTYQPWHHENYYPIEDGFYQSGYYKSNDYLLKVSVISTKYEPDIRKGPYKLWVKFVDHTMGWTNLKICNLVVQTSSGRNLYIHDSQCINIPFEQPSLVDGVEPYAKQVIFIHEDMQLDFEKDEELIVSFTYSLEAQTTTEPVEINLLFRPSLDKGSFKPCCLPSV